MATFLPTELLDWLEQNQFLTPQQLEPMRVLQVSFPDCHALAKELIRRDWLTPFQVNQILQGRHSLLVVDSYRLRERIGEGAMGQVYKAWQPARDRVVALKMMLKEMAGNAKAMGRFRREIETASQLDHPNIAKLHDAGDVGGRPYLVLEFVDGFNLSSRVKQQGALPIPDAVEYARQAALGLQHAHERGIVHRDIKPGNLLVTKSEDGRECAKILDFGLARYDSESDESERLTQVGRILGTIDYIAPEQATDARNADIRADIYSLGCTLFYLLTAQPPFGGETMVEKLSPRVTGEPPWVRTGRPDVPPGLEEVLRKMMARKPEDRFQTPSAAAEALGPYAIAMTIPEAPPTMAVEPAPAAPIPGGEGTGILMAMPVAPGAVSGNVLMAQPIAAPPVDAVEPAPAFAGMSATGRALDEPVAPRTRTPAAKKGGSAKLVLILGSAFVLLSLFSCACILGFFFMRNGGEKKVGVIKITEAKWSMGDGMAIPGRHHHVLVWIDRIDCKGPIKVTMKGLPPGVTCDGLTFPPNVSKDQVRFTVSYGTAPLVKEVKVFAECEEDGARDEYPLTLTVKEDPTKLKK